MDSNDLIEFLNNFEFPEIPKKVDNIFEIGMQNMYENPFTEILAYILNENSPFIGRKDFIKYFIFGLTKNTDISNSFSTALSLDTQIYTKNGKFIDLVIFNNIYVLTLENKIDHIPNNPFEEYEAEINLRFKKQNKLYYLFTFHECENIGKWINILIGDVFLEIKKNLVFKNNKWDYFLNDFLDHYIKEVLPMTKKDIANCEKNFAKLMEARDLLDNYTNQIKEKVNQKLKPNKIKHENWDGIIALRIKPFEDDYPDIVLFLDYGVFYLAIYYNDQSKKNVSDLIEIVGEGYKNWLESGGKYICFETKENNYYSDFNSVFSELELQMNKIKEIYSKKQRRIA